MPSATPSSLSQAAIVALLSAANFLASNLGAPSGCVKRQLSTKSAFNKDLIAAGIAANDSIEIIRITLRFAERLLATG